MPSTKSKMLSGLRNAEHLVADRAVPAVEAPEMHLGRSVRQPPRFDRVGAVDRKQEQVAVAGVESGGVLGHVNKWTIGHGRRIQYALHLPPRVAGADTGRVDLRARQRARLWTHLGSKLFETVAALASADGHLPNRARKAIRFGPPRLASPGFVKKLRHAGTQCYSKAAQRVDPDV
jgi:hypothetical protein